MTRKKEPVLTKQAWLNELGRRLVWYFPTAQVKDILSDYREQFEAGHIHCKTQAEIIQGLGTPAEAAALLLEEEPSARTGRTRQNILWGAALAVCFAFWWMCFGSYSIGLFWIGSFLFIPVAASVLFMLIRSPARMELERLAAPEERVSRATVWYIPAALTLTCVVKRLGLEAFSRHLYAQYESNQISSEHFEKINRVLRYGNALFAVVLILALALLTVWMLTRCVRGSVRHFPGVSHAFGALESVFFSHVVLFSTPDTLDWERTINICQSLLPYFAGLATALVFRQWVDGRKPLPRFFQGGAVSWQDWRHWLGVSLLGWFPVEQTLEIIGDYQEQYELGREQGKAEDGLLSEMGRPETVVRDLLAEDRKARLNRRKSWPWVVLAALAGWLLLGLLRGFEFGGWGLGWFYCNNAIEVGLFAVVTGTIALFFLLHSRERAAVERRFPAPQVPSPWFYLLPLLPFVFSAVVEGLSLWLIYCSYRSGSAYVSHGQAMLILLSIEFSALLLMLLLIYTLARCVSGSIRHFPAVPHIAGSFASVLCAGMFLTSMDMSCIAEDLSGTVRIFLTSVYPYLAGLLLAIVSWLVLRASRNKEG